MQHHNRHIFGGKRLHSFLVVVGGVFIVLSAVMVVVFLVAKANTIPTSSARPTTLSHKHIAATPLVVATSPHASQPTPMIPVKVSAYTIVGTMADGEQTHVGACAVSTAQFPLGTILSLYNSDGSFNRQCIAEDTGSDILAGSIDVAMPGDVAGATRWGIRHLWARVIRRGWGPNESATPLPSQ